MQLRSGKVVYNGMPLINEKGLTLRMPKFAKRFSDIQQEQSPPPPSHGMKLRSRVIIPEKGNSTYKKDEIEKKLKSDFKIVMFDIIGHRIKLIENLYGSHDDYLNKMRLIYEIYYSLNYYSDTIFSYMQNNEEEKAITKLLITNFLKRIQVMYNEIPTLPQTPEFMKMFNKLYDIWNQTLHTYKKLYV